MTMIIFYSTESENNDLFVQNNQIIYKNWKE